MESLTSPDQIEIYEFLKKFPNAFVSVAEISKNVGNRRRFNDDRNWTRPILRRMEMEGWLESNSFAEYRVKRRPEDTAMFMHAIKVPGMDLGDTTIIRSDRKNDRPTPAADTAQWPKDSAA